MFDTYQVLIYHNSYIQIINAAIRYVKLKNNIFQKGRTLKKSPRSSVSPKSVAPFGRVSDSVAVYQNL